MLAAVTQHAAIPSALPPRAPTTAADDFAFCVYAVVAVAVLAAVAEMLAPRVRMDCLCLAPASLLIFVHARAPISLDAGRRVRNFFCRRHRRDVCFHAGAARYGRHFSRLRRSGARLRAADAAQAGRRPGRRLRPRGLVGRPAAVCRTTDGLPTDRDIKSNSQHQLSHWATS